MYFFITILTAISLSLDAFSLSIIYGTIIDNKKVILKLSIIVGIFHFFMPLFGYLLSKLLILNIVSNTNLLSFIIFLILGIEMILNKNDELSLMNLSSLLNILIFSLTVSIDSFSIGIAISQNSIITPIITFSIVSAFFTYLGLILGKKLKNIFGSITTKAGGLILIMLSFYYLFT